MKIFIGTLAALLLASSQSIAGSLHAAPEAPLSAAASPELIEVTDDWDGVSGAASKACEIVATMQLARMGNAAGYTVQVSARTGTKSLFTCKDGAAVPLAVARSH